MTRRAWNTIGPFTPTPMSGRSPASLHPDGTMLLLLDILTTAAILFVVAIGLLAVFGV